MKLKIRLEERLGELLQEKGLNISVAESCTGGFIAKTITDVPGASLYFEGGVVTYSNRSKSILLMVPEEVISKKGAVSKEVAEAMAKGVKERLGTDIGLAVTGIAGPAGGTEEKPVGTVYIGLAIMDKVDVRHFIFKGTRDEVRTSTVEAAIQFVIDYMDWEVG